MNPDSASEETNRFEYAKELSTGWFSKPHGLIALLQDGRLNKCEYVLMDFLLSFKNRHNTSTGWFFVPDKVIRSTRLLSSKKIIDARRGLSSLGLIEYKKGNSHRATEYRILIPIEYYRRPDTVQ